MKFTIESEQEEDGRWLAEVMELPGVMVYGQTPPGSPGQSPGLGAAGVGGAPGTPS